MKRNLDQYREKREEDEESRPQQFELIWFILDTSCLIVYLA